jgi:hypothetical protein
MQFHFWYILIHCGLGVVGYKVFLFTNTGGLYAAAAAALVQGYAVWEIHRIARPRFEASLRRAASHKERQEMIGGYRTRLARTWFFRLCIYSLLTLIVAWATRGGTRL